MPSKVVTTIELGTALLNGFDQYLYVAASGDLRASGTTVTVSGTFCDIINNGAIASLTESGSGSPAIAVTGFASISNLGLIASTGKALECSGSGSTDFTNSGTIVGDLDIRGRLGNTGTILGSVTGVGFTEILNSGVINAGLGPVISAAHDVSISLINTGEILSSDIAIRTAVEASDIILNAGLMTGYVDLRGGDDVFDGQEGKVLGRIFGGDGADTILGGANADIIDGGRGSDLLDGGAGFDLVSFNEAIEGVFVDLQNEALNTGEAANDIFFNFEGVIGSGFADTLSGNSLGNDLRGGAGADVLDGRAGNDTMRGNGGDDLMVVDAALDRIIEGMGQGTDTVTASVTYRLAAGAEVEFLTTTNALGATSIHLTGSNTANSITGNAGINRLYGMGDADTLQGLGGADFLDGGDGNDVVRGGDGNDNLTGGAGSDTLDGGAGNDRLVGGVSADFLTGGTDGDIFTLDTVGSPFPVWDVITDFSTADDTIWLKSAIVPGLALGALAANALVVASSNSFTSADQRILYNTTSGRIFYDADGTGAGSSALIGELSNLPSSVLANDFFVIA